MSLPVVIIRTNRRARLGDATVRIYSALRKHGQLGAEASELAGECEMRLRSAAARLSWLRRAGIVNATSGRWTVVDNALFRRQAENA